MFARGALQCRLTLTTIRIKPMSERSLLDELYAFCMFLLAMTVALSYQFTSSSRSRSEFIVADHSRIV